MRLQLLRQTTCLAIYYDSPNDWLFLDWEGELTLPDVQAACVALAQCFLNRPYPRVLNSNAQVTNVSWSVAAWLALEFLPHLTLAGVEHVAWISSPSLRGRNMMQTIVNWLPNLVITLFDDMEGAVHSLQQLNSQYPAGCFLPYRLPAAQAQLAHEVEELIRRCGPSILEAA